MKKVLILTCGLIPLTAMVACSSNVYNPLEDYEQLSSVTILEAPIPVHGNDFPLQQVERGRYLVGLLGCGSCHTDGALIGTPDPSRLLAGSGTGIAYSNPLAVKNPGVVYPANLTPDNETGIGDWRLIDVVRMVRTGLDSHGTQTLPVMPWPAYAGITEEDAYAIASYLKSLAPVKHKVPVNVAPGQRAVSPYVHFGVYRSKG